MVERLKIRAQTVEDIEVLSAIVQDGIVRLGDVHYDKKERRFVLLFNRYRWEGKRKGLFKRTPKERVRAALRFDFVDRVQSNTTLPDEKDDVLELLAIQSETSGNDNSVTQLTLIFSGGISIRLTMEVIDATLDDLSAPWPAKSEPRHLD